MSSNIAGSLPDVISITSGIVSISGGVLNISGQPITVSGNQVFISGQPVSVSGNAIGISGQAVLISGQTVVASVTTNISGQTVYLVSGQNPVQLYGFDPSGVALRPLIVNQSGGNVLRVDAGAINVASNVSGNVVYLVSGQNPTQLYALDQSGQQLMPLIVNASGSNILRVDAGSIQVSANVSGNVVYLTSGQNPVQISGQLVVVSGIIGANVSGNVVEPMSGGSVRLHALDLSGNQWLPLALSASGKNRLAISIYDVANANSVTVGSAADNESSAAALKTRALLEVYDFVNDQFVRARVTASGQGMSGVQHKLAVAFSGDVLGSGTTVQAIIRDVTDGVTADIDNFDDDTFGTGNFGLFTAGFNLAYENVTNNWVRLRATASGQGISGIPHKLVVAFSGDPVTVSGNMVSISGQPVSVSGNIVNISGQVAIISGQPVLVSGNVVEPMVPTQIRTRDTLLITGASGGIALLSGDVMRVTVRNIGISGTIMFVGGSGDYPWVASGQTYPAFSGRGFWLRDGDGITIHTTNMAFVRVVSETSGQYVSYLGEQYPV